ncbi:MAG: bifunctional DNA-formamidopyrimidine glycosylase/DNA-(apurinic or apyrimidinic site) lyase [Planctomycetota bacterium]|nr:bifunctional DNA-formamidopyrimidine glycosylase/DNA-(apurinic or apyrimidinic site) lyase [Planctomycetota bacterium]
MPELPEVETMKRGISEVVGGKITSVIFPPCELQPISVAPNHSTFRRRLKGRSITGLGRLGKRVLVHLSGDFTLIFEPRMTGLVLVASPPNLSHLRLKILLEDCAAQELLFWDRRGLGSVKCYSSSEFQKVYEQGQLGPDALVVTADELETRLKRSRRAIKVALLDQKQVAGIGNLYASEILHLARIHPETPCVALTRQRWVKLQRCIVEVLEEAIRYEGSTLSDGTYRNALNQAGNYQNAHRVYDRAGSTCPTCERSEIVRTVLAQRSTFFCPRCQRSMTRG